MASRRDTALFSALYSRYNLSIPFFTVRIELSSFIGLQGAEGDKRPFNASVVPFVRWSPREYDEHRERLTHLWSV